MRCNLLGHWVTLDISPERSNNFEKSQLMAEIETRMKYMEPDGDGKKNANGILGDMCCNIEGQLVGDE